METSSRGARRRAPLTVRRRAAGWAAKANAARNWPVWLAVVPVAAWAGARTLGLDGGAAAFLLAFTPWVAAAALLIFGVAVAFENWAATILAGLALLALAAAVLPRALGSGESVPVDAARVRVLSANVYRGHASAAALVALVRELDPTYLAVQELTPGFAQRLQSAGLGRLLPESAIVKWLPGLDGARPGIGVYSSQPLHRAPGGGDQSVERVWSRLRGGRRIEVVTLHPLTPMPDREAVWRETLEALPTPAARVSTLILGDFNATLDQAAFRDVLDRGYRDAGAVTGEGLEPTWPVGHLVPPLITIDHVLVDQRLGISGYGVEGLRGSDHRAIWAEVFLPAPEETANLVEERTAAVTRASFERGNLSSHVVSSGNEVRQLKMYVDSVLAELLEIHAG
jgi:Endonuclease/Exonuclease/phosphatase family